MDRRTFDALVPMIYGLIVAVLAVTDSGALTIVAIVGAVLVGIYFAVLRRLLPMPGGGRDRQRSRTRSL